MYIHNRFQRQESLDLEAFAKFAEVCPKNYSITGETEYGTVCDVLSQNATGGTICTEIKSRTLKALDYEDCFIEVSKWNNLMKLWREKGIYPIYLNFFEDSKDMYVWALPLLKSANFHPNVKIYHSEEVDRIGLPWESGYHLIWDEEKKEYITQTPKKGILKSKTEAPRYYDKSIFDSKITNDLLFNL